MKTKLILCCFFLCFTWISFSQNYSVPYANHIEFSEWVTFPEDDDVIKYEVFKAPSLDDSKKIIFISDDEVLTLTFFEYNFKPVFQKYMITKIKLKVEKENGDILNFDTTAYGRVTFGDTHSFTKLIRNGTGETLKAAIYNENNTHLFTFNVRTH